MNIFETRERGPSRGTRRPPCAALRRALALLLGIGAAATAHAVDVTVIDARYSVTEHTRSDVSAPAPPGSQDVFTTVVDRTATSASPLTGAIENRPSFYAKAEASMFRVFSSTDAAVDYAHDETYAFAQATAETVLTIQPVSDATAPMAFEFQSNGLGFYSSGTVELRDLTSGELMFSYGWTCCGFRGTVPWEPAGGPLVWNEAHLVPPTTLFASHEYEVTLLETTYANDDGQFVSIGLSGLAPVAEPRSAALLGAGLLALLALAGRRRAGASAGRLRAKRLA